MFSIGLSKHSLLRDCAFETWLQTLIGRLRLRIRRDNDLGWVATVIEILDRKNDQRHSEKNQGRFCHFSDYVLLKPCHLNLTWFRFHILRASEVVACLLGRCFEEKRERSNENHLVFSNLPLFARGSTSLYLNTMMSHLFLLNRTRCSGRCTPENVDSIVLPSQCSDGVNRLVLDRLHFQSFSEGSDVGFDGSFRDVLAYRLLRRARSDYGCCPYERSEHHHVRV